MSDILPNSKTHSILPIPENSVNTFVIKTIPLEKNIEKIDSVDSLDIQDEFEKINEENIKTKLQSIAELEKKSLDTNGKIGIIQSSYEGMPVIFNGLNVANFGMSSSIFKNPFYKLKEIAMNFTNLWEDRTQSVRYMQKIPHINRDRTCIESTISIISDPQYPFEHRYHFFSNNEAIIKLNYEIVNACHKYIYENFENLSVNKVPLIYKILSAQYLLTQFPLGTYDSEDVQKFLEHIARDKNMEINYRAECADILERTGYGNYKKIGKEVIQELGDLYTENKKNTIYTNAQNVHDTSVNKQVISTLRHLIENVSTGRNTGEIYERLVELTKTDDRKDIILSSFRRIIIDTAIYEGISICDILLLVWEKICTSENKIELEKRLTEELFDMSNTCSTGHLSRIINILSGFIKDVEPVNISFSDQLRANVFARYTSYLKTLNQQEQEIIIEEMSSDNKETINEFIFSYSPRDELYEEFVPKYLTEEEFCKEYKKAEGDFFGLN